MYYRNNWLRTLTPVTIDNIGIRCETQCPLGFYGEGCENECNCKNNSSCDPDTGNCVCAAGWEGPDCSQPCSRGWYGVRCKEACPENMHGRFTQAGSVNADPAISLITFDCLSRTRAACQRRRRREVKG